MNISLHFGKAYQIVAPNKEAAKLGAEKLEKNFKAYDTDAESYYDIGIQKHYVLTGKELNRLKEYQADAKKLSAALKADIQRHNALTDEELLDEEAHPLTAEEKAVEDGMQNLVIELNDMMREFKQTATYYEVDKSGNKLSVKA